MTTERCVRPGCGHPRMAHHPRGLRPCCALIDAPAAPREEVAGVHSQVECPCPGYEAAVCAWCGQPVTGEPVVNPVDPKSDPRVWCTTDHRDNTAEAQQQ